jgi:hypothetical protein
MSGSRTDLESGTAYPTLKLQKIVASDLESLQRKSMLGIKAGSQLVMMVMPIAKN